MFQQLAWLSLLQQCVPTVTPGNVDYLVPGKNMTNTDGPNMVSFAHAIV